MSTGHFWPVDGPLLFYYLLFAIFQPAARPILLWKGFRQFFPVPYCFLKNLKLSLSFSTNLKRNLVLASVRSLLARGRSLLARRRVTFGLSTHSYYFTIYYFPARSPSNTTLVTISPIFLFSLLLTKEFETGRYYFTIYYFPARSPSNTTLNKGIHQFFTFPYCFLRNWNFLSLSIPI